MNKLQSNGEYCFVGYHNGELHKSQSRSNLTNKFRRVVNLFDFDGVVREGAIPGEYDVIVTGRTFEEAPYVLNILAERGLSHVPVYFNPIHLKDRGNHTFFARRKSGNHKAEIIQLLKNNRVNIGKFHEDDPIQASIINERHPEIKIIMYPYEDKNNYD